MSIEEATNEPATIDRAMKIGYIWRHPNTNKWQFRQNLAGRTYPEGAVFKAVYRKGAEA